MYEAALADGTSIIEADIESIKNKAIAIAPVLLLEIPISLFDIFLFSPFSVIRLFLLFYLKLWKSNKNAE
jgi:hypothetical protein